MDAPDSTELKLDTVVPFGERAWRVRFLPTENYLESMRTNVPLAALLAGLLFTALLSNYVATLRRRTARIAAPVTETQRQEEERRRLERQVFHQQKLESIGVLAGGIAHDFNNLLTGMLGNAELAQARLADSGEELRELVRIQDCAMRAAELVSQMLAFAGKSTFTPRPVELPQLFEEMTDLLRASLSKKAELRLVFAPDLKPVLGDLTQLRQVFMNLLLNASDALEDETGTIFVRARNVEVCRDDPRVTDEGIQPGTYVSTEVTDDGAGMDAETHSRVFEPFFTTKFQGRGLGLAAVQGIVRSHGGAIDVHSELGKGTTFEVLVPVAPGVEVSSLLDPPSCEGTAALERGTTVLVVDDEELVRNVVTRMLSSDGIHVLQASDGAQAIEMLDENSGGVDVVLLDLTMPRMGGHEAFLHIRSGLPELPVVLMSGYEEESTLQDLAGSALFLHKPFRKSSLTWTLHKALERRARTIAGTRG